nr:HAMP domain-containing sensor histidine kinase [uncultured Niameybacter sp.]
MKSYNKVVRKVIGGFLAIYFIMMGLFTYSKQLDVKREYRNYTMSVLHDLLDETKRVIDESETKDGIIRDLNLRISNFVDFSDEFQVYISAGVFKENECLAKSSNYLENNGLDNNLEKIPGGNKYIDLEKYLSPEELSTLVKQMTSVIMDEKKIDQIEVEGYTKGAEVIPHKLTYSIIDKRPGESCWYDEDAILMQEYVFNVENIEELEPYNGDFWMYSGEIDRRALEKHPLTLKRQEQFTKLEEKMFEWSKKTGWDWQERFYESTYVTYQVVETTKGIYGLAFTAVYYPWSVAIDKLQQVYIFSAIIAIAMGLILVRGIWKTHKKEERLEKNRRELVDAIAHELKTPLGIIQAYGEGLKENIAEDKKEHYLEVIIDETDKMNALILEMLNLSKLENKAYTLKLETFSLKQLIEDVVTTKKILIQNKHIELIKQIDDEWYITADYKCMEQVISNLLLNAIEHTNIGKRISISIKEGQVSIENEGINIPEEKLERIWDTFYKIETIDNRSGNGSGLGLAIVRNILELHQLPYGIKNTEVGVKVWFKIK